MKTVSQEIMIGYLQSMMDNFKAQEEHYGMSVQAEVQALLDLQINETQDAMQEFWGKDNDGE